MNQLDNDESGLPQSSNHNLSLDTTHQHHQTHVIRDVQTVNTRRLEEMVPGDDQTAQTSDQVVQLSVGNSQKIAWNDEDDEKIPRINCPEKIILCFDLSSELNEVIINRTVAFELLKKAIEIFVKHKLGLNNKHEFAIITFEKETLWVQDFSNDLGLILDTIHSIHPNQKEPCGQFDMTSFLETLENHVQLPKSSAIPDIPPENVVRVILIYGRSHSETPNLSDKKAQQIFNRYTACPLFFFDVLYIHDVPNDDNNCQDIYDGLCTLDETEKCYVFEVSTYVAARIHEFTAKLLAHPLQRPRQQDIDYSLIQTK